MISLASSLLILFGHWVSDFVSQPDWMGKGKSKDWGILTNHAVRITAGSAVVAALIFAFGVDVSGWGLLAWVLIQGSTHFAIDAVTSRMTGRLYAKGDHHNFFVVIGFDQFLHIGIALATFAWLV